MVERADFDAELLANAGKAGAVLFNKHLVKEVIGDAAQVNGVVVKNIETDEANELLATMVYDCSGLSAFLGKKFKLRYENELRRMAVYGHFEFKPNYEKLKEGFFVGSVIKDGWTWYIPLSENKVSIGAVVSADKVRLAKKSAHDFLISELNNIPNFNKIMDPNLKPLDDIKMVSNFGASSKQLYGKGWALVGDAALFIDPCFSSGVHLSMYHAQLLANIFVESNDDEQAFEEAMAKNSTYMYRYEQNVKRAVDTFYVTTQSKLAYFLSPIMFFGPSKKMFITVLGGDFDQHVWFMKLSNQFMHALKWIDDTLFTKVKRAFFKSRV